MQRQLSYGTWVSANAMGKKIVCLPSLQDQLAAAQRPFDGFLLGDALEWYHHLLEHIFEYLDAKDLRAASLVSPVWNDLALNELRRRVFPSWINLSYDPVPRNVLLNTSSGFKFNHPSMGVVVYSPDMIKLDQFVWINKSATFNFDKMPSFAEYIGKEIVPVGVDYCTLSCTNIYVSKNGSKEMVIFHGMLVPHLPKVRPVMFYCNPNDPETVSRYIGPHEKVRCLLMFSTERLNITDTFLGFFLKRQHPKSLAIGGTCLKSSQIFRNRDKSDLDQHTDELPKDETSRNEQLFCLAFLEEENVDSSFDAYSLVFKVPFHQKMEMMELELTKLKESAKLRQHGVVLKFCYFLKNDSQEISLLSRMFPRYHFLGFGSSTDWTVGWNSEHHIPQSCTDPNSLNYKKLKTGFPNCVLSKSIVYVIITWGKQLYFN